MTVFVASFDVLNGGSGGQVFANRQGAIDAVIGWCRTAGVLAGQKCTGTMTEEEARAKLKTGDGLSFERYECYYGIEEATEDPGSVVERTERAGKVARIEPLVALSTAHVSPAALEWMSAGGEGAVFHENEYGGFLYVGGPEWPAMGEDVPAEVRTIAEWARSQGIVWVNFDADGAECEGLEVFEH